MQARVNRNSHNRRYFESIYKLVKARELESIYELMDEYKRTVDYLFDGKTVASLLSQEGDDASVEWMIECLHPNKNLIAYETARRGKDEITKTLLRGGAELIYALQGYASVNNIDRVNELLGDGRSNMLIEALLAGFASVGNHEKVQSLLEGHHGLMDARLTRLE